MFRTKRVESTSREFAVSVVAWDDETGNAVRIEYDAEGRLLRHAVATRFPRERWLDDVVGEATWFDADDRELRRTPMLLGRSPLELD
jgi:YD repeat-containing protein